MLPPLLQRSPTASADRDLAAQARPGHGVPSQDPDPAAQFPIAWDHAAEERKTVFAGAGGIAGAALGVALAVALGEPAGVVFGCMLGAFAGALAGGVAGGVKLTRGALLGGH